MRIGNGFDVHKLVSGRDLILGGYKVPFDLGLEGHSDGDVLLHAITDALLGAGGLGDIGTLFPSEDIKNKDRSSMDFLKHAQNLLFERNYEIANIDSIVICESPRLAPHIKAIRQSVAEALSLDPDFVNVKAKTSEKLGFIGRGEAIAAQAVVLIQPGTDADRAGFEMTRS